MLLNTFTFISVTVKYLVKVIMRSQSQTLNPWIFSLLTVFIDIKKNNMHIIKVLNKDNKIHNENLNYKIIRLLSINPNVNSETPALDKPFHYNGL